MILVDTSCWIQALRKNGDREIAENVKSLLDSEQAAWCEIIRLELWHGVRNEWDRQLLQFLEGSLTTLAITAEVWQHATKIAYYARQNGLTVPVTDILIFACASIHRVEIQHADRHFDLLKQLQERR